MRLTMMMTSPTVAAWDVLTTSTAGMTPISPTTGTTLGMRTAGPGDGDRRGTMTVCGAGLTMHPGPGTTAGAAATGPWHYPRYWGYGWGWGYPSTVWVGHTGTRNHSFSRPDRHFGMGASQQGSFGNQRRPGSTTRPSGMNRENNGAQRERNFGGSRRYNPSQQTTGTRSYTPQQASPRGSSFRR